MKNKTLITKKHLIELKFIQDKESTLPYRIFQGNLYLYSQGRGKLVGEAPFKVIRDFYEIGVAVYNKEDNSKENSTELFIEYLEDLKKIIEVLELQILK